MSTEHPDSTKKIGRPTECTPETQAIITGAVGRGSTYRLACMAAGITPHTLVEWRRKGEEGMEPYATFAHALARAEAEHADRLLRVLDGLSTGAKDERVQADSAKFVLSTRYRKDYGTQAIEVEHTGTVGVVRVELPELPAGATMEDRLRALRALAGTE